MVTLPLTPLLKLKLAVAWECLKVDAGSLAHSRPTRPDHLDGRAVLGAIRADGFCVLPGFYPRPACATLREVIDSLVAAHFERIDIDAAGSDHRIWGSEKASSAIHAVYEDRTLESFAASYHGTAVANMTTLAAKLVVRPGNKGSGEGWHRDSMFERQFKAIVYLCDVGPENGPFQYVVGSNTRRSVLGTLDYTHGQANLKRFADEDVDRLSRTQPGLVRTITGKAGDVILADTRGIHRGRPIAAGVRYALSNYYTAAHRFDVHYSHFSQLIRF